MSGGRLLEGCRGGKWSFRDFYAEMLYNGIIVF